MTTGFILAPTKVGLAALPSEAQEVLNVLTQAGYRVHLIQQPTSKLELYRALDKGPFALGWVGTHAGEEGFDLGQEFLSPLEMGRFLYEAGTKELVLNVCFSVQHVQIIQSRAPTHIIATINPQGVDEREAWSTALYLGRALARTKSLERAYLEAIAGGLTQYQWFPFLGRADMSRHLQPIESQGRYIEDVLREKLAAHELKIVQLEALGLITKETLNDLRNDVREIRRELNPLSGLQVRPQPTDEAEKSSMVWVWRGLFAVGLFLFLLVVGVTGLVLYLVILTLTGSG